MRATDPDPIPARPTPADLAVVPIEEIAEHFVAHTQLLARGTDRHGRPLPDAVRLEAALYALAAGTLVQAHVGASMPELLAAALDTGAAPGDVAAALGLPPGASAAAGATAGGSR